MDEYRDDYYWHRQIDDFRLPIIDKYESLCQEIHSLEQSIYHIFDPDAVVNFTDLLGRIENKMSIHWYNERNFFRNLEHSIDAHIYSITSGLKPFCKNIDDDSLLIHLKYVLKDYLSIDDTSKYSLDYIDGAGYQDYLKQIGGGKKSQFTEDIFTTCINYSQLSERQYWKIRYYIGEYIQNIYLPAIQEEYKKILFDRKNIDQPIEKLFQTIDTYQYKMKFIFN